jgi:hypothetical protein
LHLHSSPRHSRPCALLIVISSFDPLPALISLSFPFCTPCTQHTAKQKDSNTATQHDSNTATQQDSKTATQQHSKTANGKTAKQEDNETARQTK